MPTILKTKNSVTTTVVPTTLQQGELAVNITDKKMWVGNAATTPVQLIGDGGSGNFTTVDTTNLQVTNIKAKDGTASASIANSTGIFTHATATVFTAGTVSLPAITTTGDTNTGIYFPAADTIAFTEGGVESMRIDSGGNVGIGTSASVQRLTVWGAGTLPSTIANCQLLVGNTDGFANAGLALVTSAGNASSITFGSTASPALGRIEYENPTNYMRFLTNSTERMRIDSSGNVGIGTSSPAARLHAVGNNGTNGTSAFITTDGSGGVSLAGYSSTAFIQGQATATGTSVPLVLNQNGGNVGIGTTSPQGALHVVGGYFGVQHNAGSTYPAYNTYFGAIGSNFSNGGSELDIWNTVNSGFVFRKQTGASAQTELMRINGNGNVGIGTTSPAYKLHTVGTGAFSNNGSENLYLIDTTNVSRASLQVSGATNYFNTNIDSATQGQFIWRSSNAYTERMRIDSSGNLCLGQTTADGKFTSNASSASQRSIHAGNLSASATTDGLYYAFCSTARGTGFNFFTGQNTSGVDVIIYGNGNIENRNNSYAGISDAKLKENIVDATPKLADLCKVKVRNYNFINSEDKQIGVIAQELETVFPSLVEETNDRDEDGNVLETTKKSVKYSVFVPMLIKAIQEQQTLINNLTTRLNALEGK
jgi:hypothetical protein